MSNTNNQMLPLEGCPQPLTAVLAGHVAIGAAGAITSQSGVAAAGFTVALNTAGQYVVTFGRKYRKYLSKHCNMVGPAAGTPFPTTTGTNPQFRLVTDPLSGAVVQFTRSDTRADADAASGTILELTFFVSDAA
jgi:hypothetical protein